jgi:hypothetical protein
MSHHKVSEIDEYKTHNSYFGTICNCRQIDSSTGIGQIEQVRIKMALFINKVLSRIGRLILRQRKDVEQGLSL